MFKNLLYSIAVLSMLFLSVVNANTSDFFPKMEKDPNALYANIISCKDSRLNKFKALKTFLNSPGGAQAYDNVDIKYVQREKGVKMTVHKGSATGDILQTVALTDYKTEKELHNLFVDLGLEKLLLDEEDVQRALDRMKRDAEEAYRKKRESQKNEKKELEGASELRAQVEQSRLVQERRKKEKEAKMRAEMEKQTEEQAKLEAELENGAHQDPLMSAAQQASIRADL